MRSILMATALTLASAAAYCQQSDFKGLAFGATQVAALQVFPDFQCGGGGNCPVLEPRVGRFFTYAGQLVNRCTLRFVDGQFVGADVVWPAGGFAIVRAALEAKHGQPSNVVEEDFKTQGGLASTNTVVTWKLAAGGYVRITRFSGSITEGSVKIRSAAGDKADSEQLRKEIERAKADV